MWSARVSAFERSGLAHTEPMHQGNVMLPFFGAEITPRKDFTEPVRRGSAAFERGEEPASQVRALLEGQFLNMKHHTDWIGIPVDRILLTGGASRNDGIAQVVADVFSAPVERLSIANSAALGAAILAAVTDGVSMEAAQQTFCQPAADSRIEPSLGVNYDTALEAYVSLLHSV